MKELRTISTGLRLPEIEAISLVETVQHAVHDYEQKTQSGVVITLGDLPVEAPLPVKITLYRILKESLANSYRHADGQEQAVHIYAAQEELVVEITDAGPGFEPGDAVGNGRLGLSGMRERVELLGGQAGRSLAAAPDFDIVGQASSSKEAGAMIADLLPPRNGS